MSDNAPAVPSVAPCPASGRRRKGMRSLWIGLAFLLPNILGFLTFTFLPLIASLVFAVTNWDLKYHNQYKDEWPDFVGFGNFLTLLQSADFTRYAGNTLFFMMGIPFGIAGSLIAALLLNRDLTGTRKARSRLFKVTLVVVGVLLGASIGTYLAAGGGIWAMAILFSSVFAFILITGVSGGQTVYRTLFYLPCFTQGVATFILWKKLFNPQQGPLTYAVAGPLGVVETVVDAVPGPLVQIFTVVLLAGALVVLWLGLERLRKRFRDGDLGLGAAVVPMGLLMLPAILAIVWFIDEPVGLKIAGLGFAAVAILATLATAGRMSSGQELQSKPSEGFGDGFMFAIFLMVAQFVLIGLSMAIWNLPAAAAAPDGLEPPQWLADPRWVKPSLMFVGFWGAVGSNTMLLYLAALTNVPGELYEAADIDGAKPFARFWNVTWPQLAPTTFFVVVMATIGGLQGGFEMVRTMTQGGPAGASTPLAYYVYQEGFEVGRLGFASGVAWALFLLILVITLFLWVFGNRYVND